MADIRFAGELSQFDDPPEDPLREGGNWAPVDPTTNTWGDFQKQGGNASNSIGFSNNDQLGNAYWTPEVFDATTEPQEVWGFATGGGGGVAGHGWRLGFWQNPGTGSARGYSMIIFHALDSVVFIRKYASPTSFSSIGTASGESLGENRYHLLRIDGSQVEVWTADDLAGNTWHMCCSATDTDYRTNLYVGMGAEDQGFGSICGWGSIGGGPEEDIPQIYRRPFG